MKEKISLKSFRPWRVICLCLMLLTLGVTQLWADSETVPKTTDNWTGTSCALTHAECANGSTSAQKDGDASSVTYIKFRTNKNGNTMTFVVNEGYKVTGFSMRGFANDNDKAVELASVKYDSADPIAVNQSFPNKNAGTTYTYSNTTDEATSAIVLSFGTNAGTQVMAVITITYEEVSSGPVDPTASFSDGDYTIDGTDLDLSTLFTTNSEGAITYSISDANGTGADLRADGKSFYATTAGTATVAVSQVATSAHNAYSNTATITVSACETTISGQPSNASLKVGESNPTLSVTATNVASYAWKESSDGTSYDGTSTLGTAANYTPSVNDEVQTKYYYCEVTSSCSGSTVIKSSIVTVEVEAALPPCYSFTPSTDKTDVIAVDEIVTGTTIGSGTMKVFSRADGKDGIAYSANGLALTGGSADKLKVTLGHNLQENSVITVRLKANGKDARGLKVYMPNGSTELAAIGFGSGTVSGDEGTFTYTVTTGSNTLIGKNEFVIGRNNSVYLEWITVSNCGAELFELTSAIDPVAADGKATVTLSKSLIAEGGTATATYSDIDAAYDFDEWVVSGATIDDAQANPVTITMGSTDAVITLKLKAASVKHTVTYYDGETELGTELVVEGENPTAAKIVAPHKLGYTFAGWSTTTTGAAVALNTISVAADMPLYAVYNEINCAALSGTIFSLAMDVAPAANCTIKTATGYEGSVDLVEYATISGGIAMAENSSTNNHLIITTDPLIRFTGGSGYVHISFDCALKVGDKIKTTISNQNIAYTTTSTRSTTNYFTKGNDQELTITSGHVLENATEIYLWAASSSDGRLSSLQVIRPEKFAVTFNMHGYGEGINPQYILEGGKVTEPTTPEEDGYDFGGWYKTYVAEPESYSDAWDFENDVVSAATELHAKWTEHTASSDATLKDLTVGGVTVDGFDPTTEEYNVVLEMGTTTPPAVSGTANDVTHVKSVVIMQTDDPTGDATITVTAEDNTTKVYTVHFSVATSKAIQLVFKTGTTPCVGSASTASQILSNNAAVSTYINQITFTNVEGAGDDGAEGSSLNVGKKAGNMFTLSAKAGYALQSMNFLAKIQDATCEYSINGGAWTTLTSTDTGADECYAPFSAAEVHEFRLRSTGASGVWIRNMQLTIVEACTPIVLTWDEEPVEFEVGKAGYAIAATANNGGEVAYSSTDGDVIAVNGSTGALTVSALGSVTLKAATAEGDGTTYCANGGADIEISKAVNTYYLVSFDGQNGEAADEVKYFSGDDAIALPAAPTFAGYDFQGWFDAAEGGNQYTEAITPAASMTVYAQWVAQCPGATIITQPTGASYLTGRTATALVCEATAGNNGTLSYEWFTCDDDQKTNPVAATATPSTAVAGTFYYFCKVMEAGCDVEAYSDVVTITVADKDGICLAWVNVTGQNAASLDADKSLYAPEIAASGIKSSSTYGGKTGWKFNSDPAALAIEGAPFKAGDIVEVFVTTTSADKMRVFKADEGIAANVVAEGAANMVQGANRVALTEDADNLYLLRKNDFGGWNPYVAYVAVYRACAPILNKITVAGVEGVPVANVVTIEVPASTTQSQLEAITYDWISNNDAWTADPANAPVATNAWEFGVANTVTFTDKDGDESVYTITVNKAVPSSDATLSALSASAGVLSPAFDPAVLSYTVVLPYGTSDVPTLSATKNHVGAAEPVIADAAAFVNRKAVSTVTVTAEDGTTELTYTVTFNVEKFESTVIWDGSTMSAVATSPVSGFTWAVTGFSSVTNYNATCGTKAYTKTLPSGGSASPSRNIALNVPEGYLAKFYIVFGTHSDGNNRGMFIGTTATKTLDESSVLTLYSSSRTNLTAGTSELVLGEGTWYLNPMESVDFYEISATLMPVGYQRNVTEGRMGTVCLPANVEAGYIYGAEVYTLLYWKYGTSSADCQMVDFGEVEEMQAGYPYMIIPTKDKFAVVYGDETYDGDGVHMANGFTGTINAIDAAPNNVLVGKYGIINNAVQKLGANCESPANRAYIDLSETPSKEEYEASQTPDPAPRKRVSLGRQGAQVATSLDAINVNTENIEKVIIDGKMYIIRQGHIFDATGRLVK